MSLQLEEVSVYKLKIWINMVSIPQASRATGQY